MLKENNELLRNIQRVLDDCLTVAAFISAYHIKKYLIPEPFGGLSTEPNYYILQLVSIIIWHIVFKLTNIHTSYRRRAFVKIALDVAKSVLICLLLFVMVLFFSGQQTVSRLFISLFIFLNLFFLIVSKWIIYYVLAHIRKKGYNFRYILIAGCGRKAGKIVRSIAERPESGYRLLGCLSTNHLENKPEAGDDIPVIGNIRDIKNILTDHAVDDLIIADPLRKIPDVGKYINEAEQMGVSVHIMPEWGLSRVGFTPYVAKLRFENVFGHPSLSLRSTPDYLPCIYIKNLIDFMVSGIGLVICALPFLLIAVSIKLSSRGPVFYTQERVGRNGRRFVLYKFRTMVNEADKMKHQLMGMNECDGPVFKIRKDPRVIPWVGTFLRKTSMDELPQLINVLKGEMSLVGPRPPLPEEIKQYDIAQLRRLSVKPGLTCIWQTSCRRNDVCFTDWVKMDLDYIDNWSLGLDFRILLKTALVVIRGDGR